MITNPNGAKLKILNEIAPVVYSYGTYKMVLCRCSCGNEFTTRLSKINSGWTKSCGCLQKEAVIRKNTKHGLSKTDSYKTWLAMNERCSVQNQKSYKYYGGRGIRVCDEWLNDFEHFYKDMGERPIGKTLDRINPDGNYCKKNCRWATHKEQANNKRKPCQT